MRSFLRLAVRADEEEDRANVGRTNGVGGTRGADFAEVISGLFLESQSYD